jgi:hypothetical protein
LVAGLAGGIGAGFVVQFSPAIRHEIASCAVRCFAEANGAWVFRKREAREEPQGAMKYANLLVGAAWMLARQPV